MSPTTVMPPARLPGIRFDAVAPPPAAVLRRMDIAGFVGFAAAGPIGVPVAVEDSAQFTAVFGGDAPLAWDSLHGEPAIGLLGLAVRAFFRNGGSRCWVVRAADGMRAERDQFELPGVAAIEAHGGLDFAVLRASSCGSWADELAVAASLDTEPLQVVAFSPAPPTFVVEVPPGGELAAGDLLRLRFGPAGVLVFATVGEIKAVSSPQADVESVAVAGSRVLWVWPVSPAPGAAIEIRYLDPGGAARDATAVVAPATPVDAGAVLQFAAASGAAPPTGALILGTLDGQPVALSVSSVEISPEGACTITAGVWHTGGAPPSLLPGADAFAERLTLTVSASTAAATPTRSAGLGFAPEHPRFVGALPTDEVRHGAAGSVSAVAGDIPLAGPAFAPDWYVPLTATLAPGPALTALHGPGSARARDGLETFAAGLFLDPALAGEPASTLLATAAWFRDQSPDARPLTGIHALLDNDEVTLLVVPDAVQRGWIEAGVEQTPAPLPPVPGPRPDWSQFLPCATHTLAVPEFSNVTSPPSETASGAIHLTWDAGDEPGAVYELERATRPDYGDSEQIYLGPERVFDLARPPAGTTVYLRVRAHAGAQTSGWSRGLPIDLAPDARWVLIDPVGAGGFSAQAVLEIHTAALRMCAARGDMLAVLALPEHYRTDDAVRHTRALATRVAPAASSRLDPLLSYGAVYHPWLISADADQPSIFHRTAPDGAAAGVAAGRAATRGAWVAPANEPLMDVVALSETVTDADWQTLADAAVNLVREDPGGFLWLSADTLCADPDVRPINVRRLLAVLRRTALRYGEAQAFEPGSAVSRRTVRRSFQGLLSSMFAAGAFAGAVAAEAFRVDTPVTPADLDQGRLIVELRVAPTSPLEFLTVRLVREGAGTVQLITR